MPELLIPQPNKKQMIFLKDRHKYIGFGGARGGGKSWAVRVKAVLMCERYPGIKVMIVRKTYPELQENHIIPLCEMLRVADPDPAERLARYNDSKKHIVFPNGSRILFRYCDHERDLLRFQGTEVDVLFIDEATQHGEEVMDKLKACVRGVNNFPKQIICTMNPGGEGHGWVRRLFINREYRDGENPDDYSFIQSLVQDNKALLESDPDYVRKLQSLPPKLRDAWLYGNWDLFEGQFFEELRLTPDMQAAKNAGENATADELRQQHRWCHVIPPIDLSRGDASHWTICRSYDFGYGKPFSCAWWAVDYDGTLYRILELYGCTETPNEGLRWTPDQQFRKIAEIEREHPWLRGKKIDGVADPAIWDGSRGESVAETAARYGIYFVPGDNARIAGWMQVHYRLQFDENGYARMYIFDNCASFIRTMPLLVYDERAVEDLDTSMEDHCLSGDTQVLTESGWQSIESLVGTGGRVYSSDHKLHQYHDVRCTKRNADVYAVELEDGTIIYATDDHRFMTPAGDWVYVRDLSAAVKSSRHGMFTARARTLSAVRTIGPHGGGRSMRIKSIRYAGKMDVYNMEVDDTHDFVIQGGVISHNCADETRYMCMSRPVTPIKVVEKRTPLSDPLNMFTDRR